MSITTNPTADAAHFYDSAAESDFAIEEASRTLYFDALTQMARDGTLPDATMHAALDETCFSEDSDGIKSTEVFRLVGDLHSVSTLDREARERRYAAIGKYVARVVESHLGQLVDAEAKRVAA